MLQFLIVFGTRLWSPAISPRFVTALPWFHLCYYFRIRHAHGLKRMVPRAGVARNIGIFHMVWSRVSPGISLYILHIPIQSHVWHAWQWFLGEDASQEYSILYQNEGRIGNYWVITKKHWFNSRYDHVGWVGSSKWFTIPSFDPESWGMGLWIETSMCVFVARNVKHTS